MVKQGPCCHCGVTSTPLWRNGPPDKPVLCNACGSRWRTKGTLANYTPLHARADTDYEDQRFSKLKSISLIKNKEVKLHKRKHQHEIGMFGEIVSDYDQGFYKLMDEDTSNRSSSGSAISNSESSAQFCGADASDLTGPAQSMVWDTTVPSRKRTCISRPKPSSVEKLTKDLYTILQSERSYFSGSSEDYLLFESEKTMVSAEIVHGSVLMRHPSSISREEESEASSLSVDNKLYSHNNGYSHSATLPVHSLRENKGVKFRIPGIEMMKNPGGQGVQREKVKRDTQTEKVQVLGSHKSPVCNIDLSDVVNFEEFMRQLSNEDRKQLIKYLPPVDTVKLPDSLKSLFDSQQFKENLTSFQQLLGEGVFDFSFSGSKTEDCRALNKLTLFNLTKSKWVEQYHLLKKSENGGSESSVPVAATSNFTNVRSPHDNHNHNFPDAKIKMRSPKMAITKASLEPKESVDNDGTCFSPRSLFALPSDGSSLMLESLNFVEGSSDQDLLLDIRSNSSFPQAELLYPSLSYGGQQASTTTSSSSAYPHPVHH